MRVVNFSEARNSLKNVIDQVIGRSQIYFDMQG